MDIDPVYPIFVNRMNNTLRWIRTLLILITASAFLITCTTNRTSLSNTPIPNSDPRWAAIDSLSNLGQFATALEQVRSLQGNARQQNDWRTEFKAWIYRGFFEQRTGVHRSLQLKPLEQRVETADVPLKQLLHSVIAEGYWNMYQQDRWRVLDRTDVANEKAGTDPETWTQRQYMAKIIAEYDASLEPYDTLRTIPSAYLGELLGNADGAIELRPTVYDLLARRAIQVYTNSETRLTEPEWRFKLDDAFYFELFEPFAWKKITHRDSTAWEFKALATFQELERSHLSDDRPIALTDIVLDRLAFVRQHSTLPDKDSLYLGALEKLNTRLIRLPAYSEVSVALANWHVEQGVNFDRLAGDAFVDEKRKALELCDSAIKKFPDSYGAIKAGVLRANLLRPLMRLYAEEGVAGNAPFTIAVQHTNVKKAWLRIVKDPKEVNDEPRYDRDHGAELAAEKPVREWSVELPDNGDLNAHLTELPVEGMPYGRYALLISDNSKFRPSQDLIVYANFWSTDLAMVDRTNSGNMELLVVDRTTGKPISGVTAIANVRSRDYNGPRKYSEVETFTTNNDGMVRTTIKGQQGQFIWSLKKGADEFMTGARYIYSRDQQEELTSVRTFFFTDRVIYRPGQEVMFKGIVTAKTGKNTTVMPSYTTKVEFFNTNGELVDTLNVTTDAFGSFNGTFKIPVGGLTGGMRLQEKNGTSYFQVEEYKRPTFEVVFDPMKDTPKLNEEATVTGVAKSYAGVPLDGASVQWTVKRGARMPWWCGPGWYRLPWGRETQLASGVAQCDADGKFTVKFIARPDGAFPRKADPTFFYTVEASAVDINGETQTNTTTINFAYRSVAIEINGGDALDRSRVDSLDIRIVNLNGEEVDLPMDVKISELSAPEGAPFRDRLWERPDRFLPGQDDLKNEDPNNWPVKRVHYERTGIRANRAATFLPEFDAWTVGTYRVEVSTNDPQGLPVKVSKLITIYDPTIMNTGFVNEAFHVEAIKATAEPGEKAALLVSSALPECRVLMEVERDGKIVINRRLFLREGEQLIELPVMEGDRGGFAVHFVCVERGRAHTVTQWIDVPWSNKELQVEWITFRDKLLPGSDEEWRLKITGPKKEKVSAQLLGVMYDASLDHFVPHSWNMSVWQRNGTLFSWTRTEPFGQVYGQEVYRNYGGVADTNRAYPYLNLFFDNSGYEYELHGFRGDQLHRSMALQSVMAVDAAGSSIIESRDELAKERLEEPLPDPSITDEGRVTENAENNTQQPLRSDFRETAFFFPDLLTDRDGSVVLRFKTPDALTRWKVMGLAHTPELKTANFSKETITQKPLMVVPNLPRFLREGDKITLTTKVNVIEGSDVTGRATLELFDPGTNTSITPQFGLTMNEQTFSAGLGKSASLGWEITVPSTYSILGVRISATNGNVGDGEERVLPILTDKVLVTESLPLAITQAGTRTFTLEKLKNNTSTTLKHQSLKLEFTPDPAWYAVQALPFLMEFPHECAEQTFSRYYANRLAGHIVEERPVIEQVFEAWKNGAEKDKSEGAFLSALEKNPELRTAVLEETPWVLNAKDESERKRRIALFFDLQRMDAEEGIALKKLQDMQLRNGAWPWWTGMRESRYITQHIVAGFGHLEKLNASDLRADGPSQQMLEKAVSWLDSEMDREYRELVQRSKKEQLEKYIPSGSDVHALYARTFFDRWPLKGGTKTAVHFYKDRLKETWLKFALQEQAMAALVLSRMGEKSTAALIMKSLGERATRSEELGMYWKQFSAGYQWNAFPTETYALMIEAFHDVSNDTESVDQLRQYLLKLKQTTDWKTTKATAEACYALLLTGDDLLEPKRAPVIMVGKEQVKPEAQEAGTGYFTHAWRPSTITPAMGEVTITAPEDGVQWGALHWQYLEQMDQVTPHESPFTINKKVMFNMPTPFGPELISVTRSPKLKAGDKLTVRIELRTDRYVDYVHLKDLCAAGVKPVEALSGYKYQGGLGYYQSIRDVGMHFFFDRIAPGTYVFQYDLRVTHDGDFSNGITTAMCMYAPEFSSHSEGIRVQVGEW